MDSGLDRRGSDFVHGHDWVRLVAGPDHRVVLPCSALLGAALVLAADVVARTIVQPAEMPLGVLTALIGVPLFLLMLRQFRGKV